MNTLDYLFGEGATRKLFGEPSLMNHSDADAPSYDEAHPEVRAFYTREAYEAIRADAKSRVSAQVLSGLKIPRRKACRFDSGLGHHRDLR